MREANNIMVNENIKLYGDDSAEVYYNEVAEGWQMAYDKENKRRGVVKDNLFYPTVPLDGWRARNLAEEVLGERNAGLWTIGKAVIVDARTLQELPGFDSTNQAIVDSHQGMVMIQVVVNDPGYGQHIVILDI